MCTVGGPAAQPPRPPSRMADSRHRDQDRRWLRATLLEGADAPVDATADADYFVSLRVRARGDD